MSRFAVPEGVEGHHLAVIGMAGRFPGAPSVEALWELLSAGREGISFFRPEEIEDPSLDPAELASGVYVPARGVLADPDRFDAGFFGYAAREAEVLDPQLRIFLECAWAAIENAGYDPPSVPGLVGVYAGTGMSTYAVHHLLGNPELLRRVGAYQLMLGNDKDFLATTVAYRLDLRGPAVTVQTACSTSLVAVHLAALSLASFDCDLALAGGVSVPFPQRQGHRYEEGGILSPDGHCRAFDRAARGMVGGSGAGVVVLKRLADALADGDPVRAVIRGTAANNDGRAKVGYTAPSPRGQAEVIAAAQAVAGVRPAAVGFVEGHGTGTPLGDPIEVEALKQVWAAAAAEADEGAVATPAAGRCALGSIKASIGHLDAAAGVAGLIKAVLVLENGLVPPTLHFEVANPRLGLDDGPFFVNREALAWPRRPQGPPRFAAVSSFGIGGTNAHAVLAEAPALETSGPSRPWQLLVLSARSAAALGQAQARLAAHLAGHPGEALADVAHTLARGRQAFGERLALLGRDGSEIAAALAGAAPELALRGHAELGGRPVAYLFPGQGTQSVGMGRDLYRTEAVYRAALDRCAEELAPHLGLDLRRLLEPPAGEAAAAAARLAETALAQPAVFAVGYAVAELLASWGLEPVAMLGHSLGEWVAATRAGVFSLADALRLVAARGRLMQAAPRGAMLAMPLAAAAVAPRLGEELELAAENGPELSTVAGPEPAITALATALAREGVTARRLATSHAFHSRAMEGALAAFGEELARASFQAPERRFLSCLTGSWADPAAVQQPAYWLHQAREPVRFAAALATLRRDLAVAAPVLVEVGPGRGLTSLARQQGGEAPVAVASLPTARDGDAGGSAPRLAARLWLAGVELSWEGYYGAEKRRRVALPSYPFERLRYWVEAPGVAAPPAEEAAAERLEPAELASHGRPPLGVEYVAPEGELETTLAAAWSAQLGVAPIGRHDDFFELGGHSLAALRLASELGTALGRPLKAATIVEAPTVARLAARLAAGSEEGGLPAPLVRLATASAPESGRPLFLVHPIGGSALAYRGLAHELADEGPVFGLEVDDLEAPSPAGGEAGVADVEALALRYLAAVLAVQPQGPYRLGGWSFGGLVASAMAGALAERGASVELLVLIDSWPAHGLPLPSPAELRALLAGDLAAAGAGTGEADLAPHLARLTAHAGAAQRYQPTRLDCPALLVLAAGPSARPAAAAARWQGILSGPRRERQLAGDHFSLLAAPTVTDLAAEVRAALAWAAALAAPANEPALVLDPLSS